MTKVGEPQEGLATTFSMNGKSGIPLWIKQLVEVLDYAVLVLSVVLLFVSPSSPAVVLAFFSVYSYGLTWIMHLDELKSCGFASIEFLVKRFGRFARNAAYIGLIITLGFGVSAVVFPNLSSIFAWAVVVSAVLMLPSVALGVAGVLFSPMGDEDGDRSDDGGDEPGKQVGSDEFDSARTIEELHDRIDAVMRGA